MGWAKYYEDNMSIYIGRMAMIETTSCYCDRSENIRISTIKKRPLHISGKKTTFEKPRIAQMVPGRKGLKVIFQNGVDERMIRKMQMNGWWWSKVNACWYNWDTLGNRKYAKALNEMGAKISLVI